MSTTPENTFLESQPLRVSVQNHSEVGPQVKRWSREEYYRLGEQGWFQDQRVELIDGEIIVMSPQSPEHYLAINLVRRALEKIFGENYWVRTQGPLIKGKDYSELEPDLSVVKGPPEEYFQHPSEAFLVVEISKTSFSYDKSTKSLIYASMAIPEYWVVDLNNREVLVHRQPKAAKDVPFGHQYESVETVSRSEQISPLEKPDCKIAVADILPPEKK